MSPTALALKLLTDAQVAEKVWVHITGTSAKVWGYDVYIFNTKANEDPQVEITYYYGSVGRTMQQLTKRKIKCGNLALARRQIEAAIKKKIHNGYRQTNNHSYFDLVTDYQADLKHSLKKLEGDNG